MKRIIKSLNDNNWEIQEGMFKIKANKNNVSVKISKFLGLYKAVITTSTSINVFRSNNIGNVIKKIHIIWRDNCEFKSNKGKE